MRIKERLQEAIQRAIDRCREQALLREEVPLPGLERPRLPEHGDLATNVAFLLASRERRSPREIAEAIAARLRDELVERVEVAGGGFINLFLRPQALYPCLAEIVKDPEAYGRGNWGRGRRALVEFVSANPTGPLHVGHGRGAAVGDSVARLLQATGWEVCREYYVNDVGLQMERLGLSTLARCRQLQGLPAELPPEGYRGEYLVEIAREALRELGQGVAQEANGAERLAEFAKERILGWIRRDLADFRVKFDRWRSERELLTSGAVQAALDLLKARGYLYRSDGALWFRSSAFGDEKDRVVVRANGLTTYFASDIAYHREKLERGYELLVNVWGADHHGYVERVRAALTALGYDPQCLRVLLVQLVNLLREGRPLAMSTREGQFITLREVMEEVGVDAARYIFLTRRSDAKLDFDLELAKRQSEDNPVYYVQYAHARIASIMRHAEQQGLSPAEVAEADPSPLELPEELELIKRLALFPDLVEGAAQAFEPHRLTTYLQELVASFHRYYTRHRVVMPHEPALSRARLLLCQGIATVIRNGLGLLGVSAPERM